MRFGWKDYLGTCFIISYGTRGICCAKSQLSVTQGERRGLGDKRCAVLILLLSMTSIFLTTPVTNAIDATRPCVLYAGTTSPGIVYSFEGGTRWETISPSLGWSVTSIVYYNETIYAAAITHPSIYLSLGLVYKYDTGTAWSLVGTFGNQVCFLIEYKGDLYAGTANDTARLYKYTGAESWDEVLEYSPWYGFRSAHVWNDWLYLGDYYWNKFARWDGATFQDLGSYGGSCVYTLETYGDFLYGGCYNGSIYRIVYDPPKTTAIWSETACTYLWSLKAFNGFLYVGMDTDKTGEARLYRYDGVRFDLVWSIPKTPDYNEGILSMETDGRYLYIGLGGQSIGYPLYMPANGTGQVFRTFDGTKFELISDILGTGVQTLCCAQVPLSWVGGVCILIDKSELPDPWIGLAAFLIGSTVTVSVVCVKYRKKKQT